jgi:hypothetical protein
MDEFRIVTVREREAFSRLDAAPAVELTVEEAKQFVEELPGGADRHLVLLRALAVHDQLTGFTVIWREDAVKVCHIDRIIGRPDPLIRRAVIARLPAFPKYAHVGIGLAE